MQTEKLKKLFDNVIFWGSEEKTNLIKGSEPVSQYCKLFEEYGELSKNVLKKQECIDDIGDVMVVLIILSKQLEIDLFEEFEKELLSKFDINEYLKYQMQTYSDKHLNVHLSIQLSIIGINISNTINNPEYLNKNKSIIIDNFLSCIFNLIALSEKLGYTLEQCLEHSWNVIKDREGVMYEGAWIKSTDPVYKTVLAVMGARRIHQ